MDSQILAQFIESNIAPEINKAKYWVTALKQNQITGAHQWNNLGQLLACWGYLRGLNVSNYLHFIKLQGRCVSG